MDALAIAKTAVAFIQSTGVIGILTILAIPKTRAWFGFNGNNYQAQIDAMNVKMQSLDDTVGEVTDKVADIAKDVSYIRGKLDR